MVQTDQRALLEKALLEIRRLRHEKEASQAPRFEPIAVIGMACRFPGASDAEKLYRLASEARDCITQVPKDRWDADAYYHPDPDEPGRMVTKSGGFLNDVRSFDAAFFSIAPREARRMDPQQRLLLEVTWEALEHAAIDPRTLFDSLTGVFLGLSNLEYANLIRDTCDVSWIDSQYGTGNAASVAAGRISYTFGFRGPTFAIDTACSSSLVSIHQAMQSLRNRECDLAIAGGVNLLLVPETFIHFSNARMLSPDGRCKPFSAAANGYGRAEGVGIVVLKRLQDAIKDRDAVHAVIYGSAVNHDGRSAGLTAPNGPSQDQVIRRALQNAGLKPNDIQWVEAHGTGTPLGDPIEAASIARVYGEGRSPDDPIHVTTIKANIGHAEAAAGIAGFIHACQCLKHRKLPPLLHFAERNPHITNETLKFDRAPVSLPSQGMIYGGVSSFGFSGTNCHIIIGSFAEEDLDRQCSETSGISGGVCRISGKTVAAVQRNAIRLMNWLEQNIDEDWNDVCYTLQKGRAHWEHRWEFCADSCSEAVERLKEFIESDQQTDHLERSLTSNESDGQRRTAGKRIPLPTYAFEHTEYWFDSNHGAGVSSNLAKELRQEKQIAWDHGITNDLPRLNVYGSGILHPAGWLARLETLVGKKASDGSWQKIRFGRFVPLSSDQTLHLHLVETYQNQQLQTLCVSASTDPNTLGSLSPHFEAQRSASPFEWTDEGSITAGSEVHAAEWIETTHALIQQSGLGLGSSKLHIKRMSEQAQGLLVEFTPNQLLNGMHDINGLLETVFNSVLLTVMRHADRIEDVSSLIPVAVDSFRCIPGALPSKCLIKLRVTEQAMATLADVWVWDESDKPCLQIRGIEWMGVSLAVPVIMPTTETVTGTAIKVTAMSREAEFSVDYLMRAEESERHQLLEDYLRRQLAKELEMPFEELDPHRSLAEIGLDSLAQFRLSIQVESEMGVPLSSRAMMFDRSLHQVTSTMLAQLLMERSQVHEAGQT